MKMNEFKYVLKNLTIMIGGISSIIFFMFYIFFPVKTNHGDTITVPNLIGMELRDVEEFLSDRDLRYEILEDSSYSSEYPAFTILQQNPSENEKVKENRKIYLTLNSSIPPKIKMPKIINGSVKNAQLILKSYDLRLGEITYVPDMARNAVLKIFTNGDSINENDLILKGSVIDLEVGNGLGNQVFEAPDLINLDLEEARFTIIGSGLKLGNIIYQDSGYFYNKILDEEGKEIFEKSFVYPGKVFKQSPAKSTKVKIGRRVNLWIVSKPKDEII
tara:strand:+ start:2996 stop:3817 length:822 start_codon:yes stop_codon:yes gene_type:complete